MISGKIAVVSGSSGGIGISIVSRYLSEGWKVIALDQISYWSSRVAKERVTEIICDVSDSTQVQELSSSLSSEMRIDSIVNVVGKYSSGDIFTETQESFQRSILDNIMSVFSVTKTFIGRLIPSGSIINISSVNSWFPQENSLAYNTSKGAVISMTRSLARDLGRMDIRANCIALGSVDTEPLRNYAKAEALKRSISKNEVMKELEKKTVLGRVIDPKEVSDLVFYLTGSTISITGSVIVMDSGLSIRNDA